MESNLTDHHFDGKRAMRGSAFAGTTTDNGSQQVEEPQAPIGAFPIQSFDLVRSDIMIRTATTKVFPNHGSDEA
jgi:hypothetical protein